MLKEISVKNLGCFDEKTYKIDLSEETLFAGPNNSGKSMIIAAMNLVRNYIITGGAAWSTEFYDLVSMEAAVYAHEIDREIKISTTLTDDSKQYTYDMSISKEEGWRLNVNGSTFKRTMKEINLWKKILCLRPNRSPVRYTTRVEPTAGPLQVLRPDGRNVINFLLERWTDRDKRWNKAESWLKKIDLDMSEMKTPIRGNQVALETMFGNIPVNVSLQGSGFQSAAAIVSAVTFSPEGSTIIIEEPEVFLHPSSQEVMADMINDAVNNHKKQLIFSTHSCNILLPFWSDIGLDAPRRTGEHVCSDPKKFSMWIFNKISGKISIERYPLHTKTFRRFREDFKYIWG